MELKEIVAFISTRNASQNDTENTDCKWRNCAGKIHQKTIEYKNGNLKRASSKDLKANLRSDEKEVAKTCESHGYAVHHLVPVCMKKSYGDLAHNANLSGYDINNSENLIVLPTSEEGVAATGRQFHKGNHGLNALGGQRDKADEESAKKSWIRQVYDRSQIFHSFQIFRRFTDSAYQEGEPKYSSYIARRLSLTEKLSLMMCRFDSKGEGTPQIEKLTNRLNLDSDNIRINIENRTIIVTANRDKHGRK